MWRQIGIKNYTHDRSLSKASSDKKYKRRLPYNEADSIELRSPTYSEEAFSEDRGHEKLLIFNQLQSKKDKEPTSILQIAAPYRKANSALKINTQQSDQMTSSIHLKDYFRSCSAKAFVVQSPSNQKHKRLPHNNIQLHQSLIVEQQGVEQEVKKLRAQLKKSKNLNDFLLMQLRQYKTLYQDLNIKIKQQLKRYQSTKNHIISSISTVIEQINQIKFQPTTPTTTETLQRFPLWAPIPNLKQQSISKILSSVDDLKKRIVNRQAARSSQFQSQSPKNIRKQFSPRSDRKQNALAAVLQLQELMDR